MSNKLPDDDVRKVISIADGEEVNRMVKWYTFYTPYIILANLDNQLSAIRALGNSKNYLALEYLRLLSERSHEDVKNETGSGYYTKYFHGHAKGPLLHVLTVHAAEHSDHLLEKKHPRYEEANSIIIDSLDILEKNFQDMLSKM